MAYKLIFELKRFVFNNNVICRGKVALIYGWHSDAGTV